jgi:hypothetical protein
MNDPGRALLFCLSLSLSGLACGQLKENVAVEGNDVALEDLDSLVVNALCEGRVRCGEFADKGSCAQVTSTSHQPTASVRAGRAQYDGRSAAECLAAYASLGCRISDSHRAKEVLHPCEAMFMGTVEEGGDCSNNSECVSQLCNRIACGDDACCTGTCQTKVRVGGDCSAPGSLCVETSVCIQYASSIPAICVAAAPAGQACNIAVVCEAGRICNLSAGSEQGTCGEPPAQGAACLSGICDDPNDYCEPSSRDCRPRGRVGAVCSSPDQCVGFAKCDASTSVCVGRKSVGGACVQADDCLSGLWCADGRCAARVSRACGEGA